MILINAQEFIDMSQLANEKTLVEIDREIGLGLARCQQAFLSVGYELTRGDAALDLYDYEYKDVGLAEKEL